jgi:hypothetical protein
VGSSWLVPESVRNTGSPAAVVASAMQRLRAMRQERVRSGRRSENTEP